MRYYLIAGEASGDLHASNLMKELKNLDPGTEFRFWGGDLMQKQGGELVKHYRELAFMGFLEVAIHLRKILGNLKFCEKDILRFRPDVIILVDYPEFNLRIAKFAHEHGVRVFYYISPQLWAWRSSRVQLVRRYIDHMFVILPFEKEFYAKYNVPVDFVGHPLLDVINDRMPVLNKTEFLTGHGLPDHPIIALLPGSREMEIRKILRIMLSVVPYFPAYQFLVAAPPSIPVTFYQEMLQGTSVGLSVDQTYDLLKNSTAALVTSGTATLETALLGIPQVVCYKGNVLSYAIARNFVHVDYISLVNLIVGKPVVPELIQHRLTRWNLVEELKKLLYNQDSRLKIAEGYNELFTLLGGEGASLRCAKLIVQYLQEK